MTAPAAALLDSNVVVAILSEAHEHHQASLALLLTGADPARYAISAHSYAEVYSTLTRRGDRAPFQFSAEEAWAALASLRAATILVGLTPAQAFDVVRAYSASGGIGPRLYDALIGRAAIVHSIPMIVTWNLGHMRGLFPDIGVVTPSAFMAQRPGPTRPLRPPT